MCIYANSGCNGPIEGECVGLCMHRVQPITKYRINTDTMTRPVVAIAGKVEELPIQFAEPEPTRISAAWDAYKAHPDREDA